MQVYQQGQKIEHKPDVNYVELIDDPTGWGGYGLPDKTQMNVNANRKIGNYAHEFGHLLGFGKMFANNKNKLSEGVTFLDHGQNAVYKNGILDGVDRDLTNYYTRMNFGVGINQAVVDKLNFGLGVGMPLNTDMPNNKIFDIGGGTYGQFMIQGGVHQSSNKSHFYFGQQSYTNPQTSDRAIPRTD